MFQCRDADPGGKRQRGYAMKMGRRRGKKGGKIGTKKMKISDTGGLPSILKVGPGCRVMLRKNINVEQGLGMTEWRYFA